MNAPKPFGRNTAARVQFGDLHTEFMLPICIPDPELQVGETLAVLVVTTVGGKWAGIPIGVNALEQLRGIVEAGPRVLRADEGKSTQ